MVANLVEEMFEEVTLVEKIHLVDLVDRVALVDREALVDKHLGAPWSEGAGQTLGTLGGRGDLSSRIQEGQELGEPQLSGLFQEIIHS